MLARHRAAGDLLVHVLALGRGWVSKGHGDEPGEAMQGDAGVEESWADPWLRLPPPPHMYMCVCMNVCEPRPGGSCLLRGPGSDWRWEMSI